MAFMVTYTGDFAFVIQYRANSDITDFLEAAGIIDWAAAMVLPNFRE